MAKKTKSAEKKPMTVEEFMERYNGVGVDFEELARIAATVEGEVGEAGRQALAAIQRMDAALEAIDFEVG